MTLIFIVPAPGRRVHHEDGRAMIATGETVTQSTWWRRRLADGDVLLSSRSSKKKDPA